MVRVVECCVIGVVDRNLVVVVTCLVCVVVGDVEN